MSIVGFDYLFNDETQIDTMKTIDELRARVGARTSLAQVAQALVAIARNTELVGGMPETSLTGEAASSPLMQTIQAVYDVMDHLPVGVGVVDAGLQVHIFNRMARELLEFPESLFVPRMPHFRLLLLFNARRGEYGPGDPEVLTDQVMERVARMESHHFERKRPNGTVLDIRGEPLPGGGFVTIWTDVTARSVAEAHLAERNMVLEQLNQKLMIAQQQLLQSEKLASIGQLAAGVAHEINNPIGYVHSNIGTLETYVGELFEVLKTYEAAESSIVDPECAAAVKARRQKADLEFLKEDIPMLMRESREGITRVKKIVQDLKDFSHVDETLEWHWANLHQGLDSTINIASNEVKYKADVVREYGQLPDVECLPSQLNQVFLNLLVNAAHAMGEARGTITVRSGTEGETVWLEFSDNGCGIPEAIQSKIFDPFFTTKPVGKGTGLGLSLSFGIIQKHNGSITVRSSPGEGTTFRIVLPIKHIEALA